MTKTRIKPQHIQGRHPGARGGFTLVELLVTAGLVMLMMSLFAQIFQIATGTMSIQRGIAENDQRARTLTTIIKEDLKHRTFRTVLPFLPEEGEDDFYDAPLSQREGYFYISENDPDIDTDDVLQFTIRVCKRDPHYGRANYFFNDGDSTTSELNQPDWDDGLSGNGAATSTVAEVTYFLRGGNLYRRVLLIRQKPEAGEDATDVQPQDDSAQQFFDPTSINPSTTSPWYPAGRRFWNDFDYSVHFDSLAGRLQFNGLNSMSNAFGSENGIGQPRNRFGHNPIASNGIVGRPREYTGTTRNPEEFFGRFTQEETSHSTFIYPYNLSNGNPMESDPNATGYRNLTLIDGVIDEYRGGPRRAEDILMTNVIAFDVKALDELYDAGSGTPSATFADIGHGEAGLLAQSSDNAQPSYGPLPSSNRVFDTWNPNFDVNDDDTLDATADAPPFDLRRTDASGNVTLYPLRAVQVRIVFHDLGSDQVRQLTLVQGLTDAKPPACK